MTPQPLDPIAIGVFVLAAFTIAGLCQAVWLGSDTLRGLARPLDAGLTLRGRRLLGDHKTLRGLLVMMPATGAAFAALRLAVGEPEPGLLWTANAGGYFAIGLAAGAGFMAGELPNSFVKRQLDIAPGEPGAGRLRCVFAIVDRMDSVAGALVALHLVAGVPAATWLGLGLGGPVVHGLFSVLTFQLGGKTRMA